MIGKVTTRNLNMTVHHCILAYTGESHTTSDKIVFKLAAACAAPFAEELLW